MTFETNTTSRRTITAFYDDRSHADAAVQRLIAAGIERDNVTLRSSSEGGSTTATYRNDEPGFWESLKDLFVPDEDRATYAEGLRRGGFLVTAQVNEAAYEKALDILDQDGTVDLDQRAQTWRNEGWTGYTGATGGATRDVAGGASALGAAATGTASAAAYGTTSTTRGTGAGATTNLTANNEEVIPVTEEELRVGKREVSHGRVRVRSYVVETPVSEQIGLREEHVQVERRPVDRVVTGAEAAFTDRTIEATESAEEAVVSKEARVKEELVIRKTAEERAQTVSDTVRRTEVEVEDERSGVNRSGSGTAERKIS